ncbi:putative ATP-dependent RNA helicase DHX58 [Microtus ochrogaster]|uniref:RNA helicase n=1 Tax=Microtus ochrogaster TaxID=79684 RepID=A0A8J6G5U8_MICOH|nr:putative ATP-dependent RNA helicase DHX58 [Microtus ochrogaster]
MESGKGRLRLPWCAGAATPAHCAPVAHAALGLGARRRSAAGEAMAEPSQAPNPAPAAQPRPLQSPAPAPTPTPAPSPASTPTPAPTPASTPTPAAAPAGSTGTGGAGVGSGGPGSGGDPARPGLSQQQRASQRKAQVRGLPRAKKLEKLGVFSACKANETCKCNGWKNPKPPTAPRMDLQQPAANLSELCRSCEHPLGTGSEEARDRDWPAATEITIALVPLSGLCANLDTWRIMSPENCRPQLLEHNPKPCKQYDLCQRRREDPFGDLLKELMKQIHQQLAMPELSQQFGTQTYEQQVVELSKAAAEAGLQQRRVYALHLQRYNDALLTHDTVRAQDALDVLQDFYHRERATKTQMLRAERWLLELFDGHKNELAQLAACGPENPKLEMLEGILLKQFGSPNHPRGIIFTRTRQSAYSLLLWLWQQPGLQKVNIKAQMLIGAGNTSQSTHMTQKGQQEVIQEFRDGTLNLLVATSVAEEGLDIAQCNVVVRYGLQTNEISMVQARGRARAGQSVYSFVATEGSRELQRELTNEALEVLMEQAVAAVQKMDPQEFKAKIQDLQRAALVKRAVRAAQRESQQRQFPAERVQLLCINCMVAVGYGSDLRKVEGTHHVNVNPSFSVYYTVSQKPVVINKVFKDWRPGGTISCSNCGEVWGLQMIYKSVTLPVLKIRGILLETPHGRIQAKKWSRVPFSIPDFDILQYCAQNLSDLSLD